MEVKAQTVSKDSKTETKFDKSQVNICENIRLPKLNLPSFNGNIQDWLSYRDLFRASIHNNTTLSNSQKLSYLKLSLQGEAARLIQSISINDGNYTIAWELLEERYSNVRDQVFAHIKRFMNIPPILNENPHSILKLVDTANEAIRSLEMLEQKIEGFAETLLAYILWQKLDSPTKIWWERESKKDELPKLSDLILFLKNYARTLQSSKSTGNSAFPKKQFQNQRVSTLVSSVNNQNKCICCKDNFHSIYKCSLFLKMSVKNRIDFVKTNKLCYNCLSKATNNYHTARTCNSNNVCTICSGRHHTLLHIQRERSNIGQVANSDNNIPSSQVSNEGRVENNYPVIQSSLNAEASSFDRNTSEFAGASVNSNSKETILSTAIIYIKDLFENLIPVRALLDSGSQSCFLTSDLANRLQIKKEKINIAISGLNECSLTVKSKLTTVISNKSNYSKRLQFLIVPKINNLVPGKYFKFTHSQIPQNIKLADSAFNIPRKIEVLLGVECFYELLKPQRIQLCNSELMLQESVFGFIVAGCSSQLETNNDVYCGFTREVEEDLTPLIKKFYEIENSFEENETISKSKETLICEEHYEKTHRRDNAGRYIVQIPFKEDPLCLGDSKQTAVMRLNSLWKRFERDPVYFNLYRDFIHEYEQLNHMELVSEDSEPEPLYYLPHHAIVRPEKSSTKIRVVFNASSPTSTGFSLNSIQYNGGIVQDDLFVIMLRFRKHSVAFIADVKQMYRMILIDPKQRDFQRIVWKDGIDKPIKTYKLSTVTYGTTSAPYLATKTLKQLATDEEKNFPLAAEVTKNDFYVDDVVTGCADLKTAKELQRQLILLFERGGMTLHKWASNCPELLRDTLECAENYSFTTEDEIKALGILWRHTKDEFAFKVTVDQQSSYTKRTVLSNIAKIFDPLGLIGPVITRAKIFMKKLWLLKIDWNDTLPKNENEEWQEFLNSLKAINNIAIQRCVLIAECQQIQLHGFSDASENGYGAAIYVRSVSSSSEIAVNLLCSKSRIAPIKKLTIPRLELCAAVLLAQLLHRVIKCWKINISDIYLWSDSTIVLSWIKNDPNILKTFVANRVALIQDLTEHYSWHHVRSEENPSDVISRGIDPKNMVDHDLWWHGPAFLKEPGFERNTYSEEVNENEQYFCELKIPNLIEQGTNLNNFFVHSDFNVLTDILSISNNYVKILRILVFLFRFCHNSKFPKEKVLGFVTAKELQKSENYIIKIGQNMTFEKEIADLKKGKSVSNNSKLKTLNVFLDNEGILRVGGRLKHAGNISQSQKHPAVLSNKCKLTSVIVEHYHKKYFHVGPQALLCYVRQRFWPISGRSLCRKIVRDCVICFKAKPVTMDQIMGDLPPDRVNQTFPFNVSGCDFAGPFTIKIKWKRRSIFTKVYVAVFVCFVTRAIHLEIVSDLTSESFIAALKRFFSRRGKSAKLFSDNATNFVGANSEIKQLHNLVRKPNEKLSNYFASEGVDWHFLPPRAPNFGGLWEAGVKSLKYHLKRVAANSQFTYEEFNTIIVQIEGILNSRPLTPLSSDDGEFDVLTPAHFLLGRPITALIEPNLTDLKENRLNKWQKTTKVVQQFWKKWHTNYLNTLQQRSKWMFEKNNVELGTMVLVKEDNLPPCKWSLGRVIEIYPGTDKKSEGGRNKNS